MADDPRDDAIRRAQQRGGTDADLDSPDGASPPSSDSETASVPEEIEREVRAREEARRQLEDARRRLAEARSRQQEASSNQEQARNRQQEALDRQQQGHSQLEETRNRLEETRNRRQQAQADAPIDASSAPPAPPLPNTTYGGNSAESRAATTAAEEQAQADAAIDDSNAPPAPPQPDTIYGGDSAEFRAAMTAAEQQTHRRNQQNTASDASQIYGGDNPAFRAAIRATDNAAQANATIDASNAPPAPPQPDASWMRIVTQFSTTVTPKPFLQIPNESISLAARGELFDAVRMKQNTVEEVFYDMDSPLDLAEINTVNEVLNQAQAEIDYEFFSQLDGFAAHPDGAIFRTDHGPLSVDDIMQIKQSDAYIDYCNEHMLDTVQKHMNAADPEVAQYLTIKLDGIGEVKYQTPEASADGQPLSPAELNRFESTRQRNAPATIVSGHPGSGPSTDADDDPEYTTPSPP